MWGYERWPGHNMSDAINVLIRNFCMCFDDIKTQLSQLHYSTTYCCALWNSHKSSSYKNVWITYNIVFQYLFLHKRFVWYIIVIIDTYSCISGSDNQLLRTIGKSMYFFIIIVKSVQEMADSTILYLVKLIYNMYIFITIL